jgi:hypothetical protein
LDIIVSFSRTASILLAFLFSDSFLPLSRLESALVDERPVLPGFGGNRQPISLLFSALTQRAFRKPFRIRTYKK